MIYQFQKQLDDGKRNEETLDRYFSRFYRIHRASLRDEKERGIDRYFTEHSSGMVWTVEYKSDSTAARTGNLFLETISVDRDGAAGWLLKSQAQVLVYYLPPCGQAHVYFLPLLKARLRAFTAECPTRAVPNQTRNGTPYNTIGLLIPIAAVAHACVRVLPIQEQAA